VASISRSMPIHLGLDVHKDTILVGILPADQQIPQVERITHDEASIRRLACRLGNPRMLQACYQHRPDRLGAGPAAAQHGDQLPGDRAVAHPKAPGDKARDRPTRLPAAHRGCTAPASWSPSASHRPRGGGAGSCRTRSDMVQDLTRARNRLGKFLLRHGRVWRGGRPGRSPTRPGLGGSGSTSLPWPDVRPLPGRGPDPQRATRRRGGRPCRLVRPAAI
jgi:transposase